LFFRIIELLEMETLDVRTMVVLGIVAVSTLLSVMALVHQNFKEIH
jgi:hypothetical protein